MGGDDLNQECLSEHIVEVTNGWTIDLPNITFCSSGDHEGKTLSYLGSPDDILD